MIEFLHGLFLSIGFTVSVFGSAYGIATAFIKLKEFSERRKSHEKRLTELLESISHKLNSKP